MALLRGVISFGYDEIPIQSAILLLKKIPLLVKVWRSLVIYSGMREKVTQDSKS